MSSRHNLRSNSEKQPSYLRPTASSTRRSIGSKVPPEPLQSQPTSPTRSSSQPEPVHRPFRSLSDFPVDNDFSQPNSPPSPPSSRSLFNSTMSNPPNPGNQAFPPFKIVQNDHLLIDFSTMEKARQTLSNYLVRSTRSPINKDYANQVIELLTKLESRSLKWSCVTFQLLTLPDTADTHELTSLQSQLSIIPEFRQSFTSNNRGRGNSFRGRGRGRGFSYDPQQQ